MLLFSAEWCGACKPVKSLIETDKLDVELVDIDSPKGMDVATQAGIRGIPALVDGDTFVQGADEIMKYLRGNT